MKRLFTYSLLAALLIVAFVGCKLNNRQLPSLTETYRMSDKLPFGAYVAYTCFQRVFNKRTIEIADKSFAYTWNDIRSYSSDGEYSLYFLVTKNLVLRSNEITALMSYVKAGNDLFISADYIDQELLDAIYCSVDRRGEIVGEVNGKMRETHVSMYFGKSFDAVDYGYYYFPFLNNITDLDTSSARVLGVNEKDQPNYAVLFSGRGRIYLHVAPRVFSNYFLLTDNNFHYFENVISFLRLNPKNIYWDEYYKESDGRNARRSGKNSKDENFSSLQVIKQNPSLMWAFALALGGMLIYVIFKVKRTQRVIEVIKPNSNSTVAFAETVGRLYLQQKNNGLIADKMITFFYEHIRNKYFISTSVIDTAFVQSLAGKSGVPLKETSELFDLIKNIQSMQEVSDESLLDLNLKIENFNKTKT